MPRTVARYTRPRSGSHDGLPAQRGNDGRLFQTHTEPPKSSRTPLWSGGMLPRLPGHRCRGPSRAGGLVLHHRTQRRLVKARRVIADARGNGCFYRAVSLPVLLSSVSSGTTAHASAVRPSPPLALQRRGQFQPDAAPRSCQTLRSFLLIIRWDRSQAEKSAPPLLCAEPPPVAGRCLCFLRGDGIRRL